MKKKDLKEFVKFIYEPVTEGKTETYAVSADELAGILEEDGFEEGGPVMCDGEYTKTGYRKIVHAYVDDFSGYSFDINYSYDNAEEMLQAYKELRDKGII